MYQSLFIILQTLGGDKMNENSKKQSLLNLVKAAQTNPIQQIETKASDLFKSQHVSPLDACTCTGNCDARY